MFLPPLALWAASDLTAVLWDGLALHLRRGPAAWALVSPTQAALDADPALAARGVEEALEWEAVPARTELLTALLDLSTRTGAFAALPGALAQVSSNGCTAAIAALPDAPAGEAVIPRLDAAFAAGFLPSLHAPGPDGQTRLPIAPSAHERVEATTAWGGPVPPGEPDAAWLLLRQGRASAVGLLELTELPCLFGIRVA